MGRAHFDRDVDSLLYLYVGSYLFLLGLSGTYCILWPPDFPGNNRALGELKVSETGRLGRKGGLHGPR